VLNYNPPRPIAKTQNI